MRSADQVGPDMIPATRMTDAQKPPAQMREPTWRLRTITGRDTGYAENDNRRRCGSQQNPSQIDPSPGRPARKLSCTETQATEFTHILDACLRTLVVGCKFSRQAPFREWLETRPSRLEAR